MPSPFHPLHAKGPRVVVRAETRNCVPDCGEMTRLDAVPSVQAKVGRVPRTERPIAAGRTLRLWPLRVGAGRALRCCLGVVALAVLALLDGQVNSVNAKTVEWREEVPLQDGGKIVVAWRVELVAGEP